MKEKTPFKNLLYTRKVARRFAYPQEWWAVMHSDAHQYEDFFYEVLEGKKLENIVQKRKSEGKDNLGLDVMGHGHVLRDLRIQGASIAMGDNRTFADRTYDERTHSTLITGDVLFKSTWRKLNQWLGDRKFSLILSKGEGGLFTIPEDPNMTFFIFEQLYNTLSNDDGVLVAQMPDEAYEYLPLLQQIPDVDVKSHELAGHIKLTKRQNALERLPLLL